LDKHFRGCGYLIRQTTRHEERVLYLGDRHFSRDGQGFFVEYKSGIQTHYTGKIFLETVSVDTANKPGWVYTSQADYIYYACLLDRKILVFVPDKLRAVIENLKLFFKEVETSKNQNKGYNTHGLLIPLAYAEETLAQEIIRVSGEIHPG
jgi:hypothetical protein